MWLVVRNIHSLFLQSLLLLIAGTSKVNLRGNVETHKVLLEKVRCGSFK